MCVQKTCKICGKLFDAKGNSKTCDKECSEINNKNKWKNYRQRQAEYKQSKIQRTAQPVKTKRFVPKPPAVLGEAKTYIKPTLNACDVVTRCKTCLKPVYNAPFFCADLEFECVDCSTKLIASNIGIRLEKMRERRAMEEMMQEVVM